MNEIPAVLTLKEVLPFVRLTLKGAHNMLAAKRFPIRHIDTRPYRFARADVVAYAEHGVKTNPLVATPHRRFFQAGRRARHAKELLAS